MEPSKADEESKRKRDVLSSNSELESSMIESATSTEKAEKQKKKKSKQKNTESTIFEKTIPPIKNNDSVTTNDILKQMQQINTKLEKLETSMLVVNKKLEKDDTKSESSIKAMMKGLLTDMKDELLKNVTKNIEILEGRLFEKEQECDKMKQKIQTLESNLDEQKSINQILEEKVAKDKEQRLKYENEAEQYSRRNNIKIKGLTDTGDRETARETAVKVIKLLAEKEVAEISMQEIDIAHRLPNKDNKNREVIVKFVSRNTKEDIMKNKKKLSGTGVFINEDLTQLNMEVFMSVKKKVKEEVKEVWTRNGKIMYKNCMDHFHVVKFEEFETWLNLPWPKTQ